MYRICTGVLCLIFALVLLSVAPSSGFASDDNWADEKINDFRETLSDTVDNTVVGPANRAIKAYNEWDADFDGKIEHTLPDVEEVFNGERRR